MLCGDLYFIRRFSLSYLIRKWKRRLGSKKMVPSAAVANSVLRSMLGAGKSWEW